MIYTSEKGWIKLDRSLTESFLWNDTEKFDFFRAWIDILFSVNFKAKPFILGDECITIEKGCILTSVLKLSKRWQWDRKTVNRFLKLLKSAGMIDYKKFANGTLIKVLSDNRDNSQNLDTAESDDVLKHSDGQLSTQIDEQLPTNPIEQPEGYLSHITKESKNDNNVFERKKERADYASSKKKSLSPKINNSRNDEEFESIGEEFERIMWEKFQKSVASLK